MLLPNGNILLFDNGSTRRWSRVLEMDPLTGGIVWEYRGDPPESFFSHCCGSVKRLENGNVVITDATRARVFEVTPDKEVVWDYWNRFKSPSRRNRVSIFRSHRVPPDLVPRR